MGLGEAQGLVSLALPRKSLLIAKLPQDFVAPGLAVFVFHALGGNAVHYPQDAPALFSLGQ